MKKIFMALYAFAFVAFTNLNTYTYSEVPEYIENDSKKAIMTICDDENNIYEIKRTEVEEPVLTTRAYLGNEKSVSYTAAVPSAILNSDKASSGRDDSYCANVSLRIYYTEDTSSAPYAYRLNRASGSYKITDPNITSRKANLNFFYSGWSKNNILAQDSKTVQNIGTSFNQSTGFTQFVSLGGSTYMGSSVTFDFAMGSRKFTGEFKVCI